jgi:purine nucleoside phosphorylase
MPDEFTLADAAAQFILQRTPLRPQIGLVLGSGLGGFADSLTNATRIP